MPKSVILRLISSNSILSKSSFQVAISETELSAIRNAFTCSSERLAALTHGTSDSFKSFAAFRRVCPATITLFLSITIGT